MDRPLGALDPDKYRRLCELLSHQALGRVLGFAVCDRAGSPLWAADTPHRRELGAALRVAHATIDAGAALSRDIGSGKRLLVQPLAGEPEERIAALALLVDCRTEPVTSFGEPELARALADIGACLLQEYRLNLELNTMAAELTARCEELNLVYATEERVHKYEPEHGREVLTRLVEDCIAYLGVDGAVLAVPGDRLEVKRQRDEGESDSAWLWEVWPALRHAVYRRVKDARASIVVNDASDPPWLHASSSLPVKVLASPMLATRSEVFGIIALVNLPARTDFSNGDRKLLEVLAEQAATVLQASRDALTGLLNRRGFEQRLTETVLLARSAEAEHVLLFLDLDGFKIVNDTCGSAAGDELLRQIALLLDARMRSDDVLARLGDDEFAILLKDCPTNRGVLIARKLINSINQHRFDWDGNPFDVSASVGVASVTAESGSVSEILSTADTACRLAKQQGYNRAYLHRHDDAAYAAFHREMQWVPRIQRALEENRLQLYAQPIEPLCEDANTTRHCEILLRMIDETGRIIRPAAFIAAAERYQSMPAIDRWVIRNTLQMLAASRSELQCAINISRQSFSEVDFLKFAVREVDGSGVAPQQICFEITETAAISNLAAATRFMHMLGESGCRFALDDFGEGVSSFSSLKQLPLHYLKIDGSLIRDIDDPVNYVMVDAVNRIGQTMRLQTVAEFVENASILEKMRELGVDFVQGFAIGKPRPLAEYLFGTGETGRAVSSSGQLRAEPADLRDGVEGGKREGPQ
ncbi:MAG: EAL domain-containing protein [Gammaproteobacteria bacterium]|nr:EAL domain-containing protein [Gammaproteobacteria bacterium]NIR84549.1 EAL domain-containing protein [Gammaproteobacteria bacterium]NIR90452.1 EAL domain-containing protein [Gammaproteobacteria bacterium]NIU05600.1 EAL domain-containing protein [Gammaproteobacteria bacterium]NIV52739.1 EAL domain-containing protein [Gammaproteobacteria bacterium]